MPDPRGFSATNKLIIPTGELAMTHVFLSCFPFFVWWTTGDRGSWQRKASPTLSPSRSLRIIRQMSSPFLMAGRRRERRDRQEPLNIGVADVSEVAMRALSLPLPPAISHKQVQTMAWRHGTLSRMQRSPGSDAGFPRLCVCLGPRASRQMVSRA